MNFNDIPNDLKYLIFNQKSFKKERKKNRKEIRKNKRIYNSVITILNRYHGFEEGRDDVEYSECFYEDLFEEISDFKEERRPCILSREARREIYGCD